MELLYGRTAKSLIETEIKEKLMSIKKNGENVRISLFRVGERDDDCGYERSILKSCDRLGICADANVFPEDVKESDLVRALQHSAADEAVDGILLFRPLPKNLQTESILTAIPAVKDIDGMLLDKSAFTPCTPEACMQILRAYQIEPKGKRCVVIGRSAVVGKPLARLLTEAGAIVTVCHTQTPDVPAETRKADLLFVACGKPNMVDEHYLSDGQIVIDVGFHVLENGFCGDVNAEAVAKMASAYTPVPGGVGAVTLSVLLLHAVTAHERKTRR